MPPSKRVKGGIRLQKTTKTERIVFPEHGLTNDNGDFFPHAAPYRFNREDIELLKKRGMPYSTSHFTKEEDDIIRRNWESFANRNDIPIHEAPKAVQSKIRDKHKDIFAEANFTRFWPILCNGIRQRSAHQIQTRVLRIYDPALVSGDDTLTYGSQNKELSLTDEQLEEIDQMLAKGMTWPTIASKYERTVKRCLSQYRRWCKSSDNVSKKLWTKLWKYVEADVEDEENMNETMIYKKIRSASIAKSTDMMYEVIDSMDVASQAEDLNLSEESIRETWILIIKSFRKYLQREGKTQKAPKNELFRRAVNETIKYSFLVTFNQRMEFLDILIKATPKGVFSTFKASHYNVRAVETEMKKRGVTNFYCGNLSEFKYLFVTVRSVLYRCEKLIFSKLCAKYSIRDRLTILLDTFELQWKHNFQHLDRNFLQRIEMDKFTNEGYVMTGKHLVVDTKYFLDVLVAFTKRRSPQWVPPTMFLKYMIRPETKKLFPKKEDNSALLNSEEEYSITG